MYAMTVAMKETAKNRQEELASKAQALIRELQSKVVEREEFSALIVLTIFSAQNMMIIGKPGVAKTKQVKIAMNAVADATSFEKQIMYDTQARALFGDMHRTPNGDLVHYKDFTVLTAEYVFLDEVFKGKSELLNGLLGVTSEEREFHPEGAPIIKVPLRTLFGVSNELPKKEILDALNDRFVFRYVVDRIRDDNNFKDVLQAKYDTSSSMQTEVTLEEVDFVSKQACDTIEISEEIADSYTSLKHKLVNEESIEASDRRLIGAMRNAMRVSAYLNGRNAVDLSDFFILSHIIWNNYSEKEKAEAAIYRHLLSSTQYVDGLLKEAEECFLKSKAYKESKLNDFLNKKEVVQPAAIEEYYQEHMSYLAALHRKLIQDFDQYVRPLAEQKNHNEAVIEMTRNNIFVNNKIDKVFTRETSKRLSNCIDDYVSLANYIEKFSVVCRDSRSYYSFNGSLDA